MDAYAISGDLASLRKIAEGNGERSRARSTPCARSASSQSDAARAALRDIYTRSTDAGVQGRRPAGHVDRRTTSRACSRCTGPPRPSDEKRALLRTLSKMDGDAALQAIDAALEREVK